MHDIERIFSDRDFSELMYPVYQVAEGTNILSKFKGLSALSSFATFEENWIVRKLTGWDEEKEENIYTDEKHHLSRNKVIKYIVYAYDRNSPIARKFSSDEIKKKTTAALYAGFSPDANGYFEPDVDDMMKCKLKGVNAMIVEYIRQYNDPEYSLLVIGYEAYFKKLNQIMAEDDDDSSRDAFSMEESRGKLFIQAKLMASDLDHLATKILTDENKLLKADLYCIVDEKTKNRLNITPERLAGVS